MKWGIPVVAMALVACGGADRAVFGDSDGPPVEQPSVSHTGGAGGHTPNSAGRAGVASGGRLSAPEEAGAAGAGGEASVDAGSGGATMGTGGAALASGGVLGAGGTMASTGGRTATDGAQAGGVTGSGGNTDVPPNGGACDVAMCASEQIPSGAHHVCTYSRTGSGPWMPTCGYVCGAAGCGAGTGGVTGTGGTGGAAYTCDSPAFGSCPVGMVCDQGVSGVTKYWFCRT